MYPNWLAVTPNLEAGWKWIYWLVKGFQPCTSYKMCWKPSRFGLLDEIRCLSGVCLCGSGCAGCALVVWSVFKIRQILSWSRSSFGCGLSPLTFSHVLNIFTEDYLKPAIPLNSINGFTKTGIYFSNLIFSPTWITSQLKQLGRKLTKRP